jgi:large subunit ribosomal protein L31
MLMCGRATTHFTGTQKIIDTEGRVERFLRKYGMMDDQVAAQDKK